MRVPVAREEVEGTCTTGSFLRAVVEGGLGGRAGGLGGSLLSSLPTLDGVA